MVVPPIDVLLLFCAVLPSCDIFADMQYASSYSEASTVFARAWFCWNVLCHLVTMSKCTVRVQTTDHWFTTETCCTSRVIWPSKTLSHLLTMTKNTNVYI